MFTLGANQGGMESSLHDAKLRTQLPSCSARHLGTVFATTV